LPVIDLYSHGAFIRNMSPQCGARRCWMHCDTRPRHTGRKPEDSHVQPGRLCAILIRSNSR